MGDLVNYLSSLGLKGVEKKTLQKGQLVKYELSVGSTFGYLTVIKKMSDLGERGGKSSTYQCVCRCGNEIEISRKEINYRKRGKKGCLKPGCGISKGRDRVFTDMYECFRDQFRRLHIHHRVGLSIMWAGEVEDLQTSFYHFADYLKGLGATEENGVWYIKRGFNIKVYSEDGTGICKEDQLDGVAGESLFIYEGEPISLKEAASILECKAVDIKDLQAEFISDEDIFESLM